MKTAYQRGLNVFGGAAQPVNSAAEEPPKPKAHRPFSLYTKDLSALGGGKPSLTEQYRKHNYVPLAPTVIPKEHELSQKITPKEAAQLYVPHRPLQFTTDRLH